MLKVQEFIRENSDWECLLSSEPFNLSISHDEVFGRKLVLFKYDQTNADFSLDIVKECRGLILDAETFEVVCFPFTKFFNYGEPHAADIDWSSAYVEQKVDGSIMKVVNLDGNFLISTNGVIDARKCHLPESVGSNCPFNSFGELFMEGMKFYGLGKEDFPRLFKPGFTYMFELTSPYNQVVVQWQETKVWFLGVRDNLTFQETFYGDHELSKVFDTPKVYPITSIDQCVAAASELPEDEEGYVVCDKDFNRIKVKSPRYVQLHYMANNQNWSGRRVLEILLAGEVSEYIAYFPKFKAAFDFVKGKYDAYVSSLEITKDEIDMLFHMEHSGMTKKDFAKWVFASESRKPYSGFAFAYFDCKYGCVKKEHPILSVKDYIDQMGLGKLSDALGL